MFQYNLIQIECGMRHFILFKFIWQKYSSSIIQNQSKFGHVLEISENEYSSANNKTNLNS